MHKGLISIMLEEGAKHMGFMAQPCKCTAYFLAQFVQVMASKVSQFHIFEVVPNSFIRVQVWGVAWQLLHPHRLALISGQVCCYCLVPVDGYAIPDNQQLALDMAVQMFQKTHNPHSLEGLLLHFHQQLSTFGYATDSRQMVPRQRHAQHWCLAAWGIRAHHTSQQVEACFVYPYDGAPFSSCFFLREGQRVECQVAMAASSRWLARRIGFWGLQPICAMMRETWEGW